MGKKKEQTGGQNPPNISKQEMSVLATKTSQVHSTTTTFEQLFMALFPGVFPYCGSAKYQFEWQT
jgi:hypothetical protein